MSICRCCLKEHSGFEHIFKRDIFEKLNALCNINIKKDDGLPAIICIQCSGKIKEFYEFQKMCNKSDTILRNSILNSISQVPCLTFESRNDIDIAKQKNVYEKGQEDECNVNIKENKTNISNLLEENDCEICAKRFSRRSSLRTHKKIHLPEKEHDCKICFKRFNLPAQLKLHREKHLNAEKKYQCTLCGKTFYRAAGLSYHMLTHSEERPYKCSKCPKSFRTKSQLNSHYRIHTKMKLPPKFECSSCGKGCYSQSELQVHVRTHTGEKPFECKICNRRFLQNVHLVVHTRSHTGEKPYHCPLSNCDRGFASSSMRKRHMNAHSEQYEFSCKICGKTFVQLRIFDDHRKSHLLLEEHKNEDCSS